MKTHDIRRGVSRAFAALALAAAVTLSPGCFLVAVGAAAGAGAGAVAYIKGELEATLAHDYEAVFNASSNAVGQMHFVLITQSKDGAAGQVTARTAEDSKVTIGIERVDANLTKVHIRVGTFGNETLSRSILDQIKRNL